MSQKHRPLVIFGLGDFSDVISYIIESVLGLEISAYTLNAAYMSSEHISVFRDRPVVPFEDVSNQFPPDAYDIVIGFIGKEMFHQRAAIFREAQAMGYGLPNIIHPTASLDAPEIGCGNIIMQQVSVEHHCSLGDGNIVWGHVVLPHHNRIGSFNNLSPSVSLSGYSEVGNHCFIGNNVAVKNRVKISDYAYIGAGAYISRDVGEQQVWVPARSLQLPDKISFDFL